ncbi:MAG: MFS transporter [Actinomycetes bacterium]|nr:MFS transporter [Actinomycetes bacterium]MDX5380885.1 MFS transporter [Actinomycetes bacterium]MDX5399964.1 MFS transporter [Actinomycetes bacterium]MDX5450634.1 MFS transporter [Actinomycetes bacterium]
MPTWRYSIGMFGLAIPINTIRVSTLLFYVDILGLDVRAYGTVMAVYAVLDAIDNPILGHLSDRTRSRWGRRRPWLVIGAVVLTAGLVGFFSAPETLDGVGLVVWFAFFAILCEAADSMYAANYNALLPELFPAERERAGANSLRQAFQLLAFAIALAATPVLTTSIFGTEDSPEGFRTTAILYAAVAVAALLFMALNVREDPTRATEDHAGFLTGAGVILRNPHFWLVGIATACYLVPLAFVLAGIQLYVKYSLGLPVAYSLWLIGSSIAISAAGLPVWTAVVRRRGAPFAWRVAFVFLAAGFVPFYFATSLATAMAGLAVVAVGWSGLLATNDLIQARVLDDDVRRHGQHREGLFLSAFGFFSRITGATAGIGLGSLGFLFGYYSGDDPGPDPGMAFRVAVSVYPFVVAAIGVILSMVIRVPEAGVEVPALTSEDRPAARPVT